MIYKRTEADKPFTDPYLQGRVGTRATECKRASDWGVEEWREYRRGQEASRRLESTMLDRVLDRVLAFLGPFAVALLLWALCIWVWVQAA